jgi:hypothetical protein
MAKKLSPATRMEQEMAKPARSSHHSLFSLRWGSNALNDRDFSKSCKMIP